MPAVEQQLTVGVDDEEITNYDTRRAFYDNQNLIPTGEVFTRLPLVTRAGRWLASCVIRRRQHYKLDNEHKNVGIYLPHEYILVNNVALNVLENNPKACRAARRAKNTFYHVCLRPALEDMQNSSSQSSTDLHAASSS